MPNWCGNVVAIFVPKLLEGLVPKVIEALRGRNEDGTVNWFDLSGIVPVPAEFDVPIPEEIVRAIEGDGISLILPRELRALLPNEGMPTTEERDEALSLLAKDEDPEVARALECQERTGSLTETQWRYDRWGVRYCCCDQEPATITDPADEYEEEDAVMIRWVFDTPNTWPRDAATRLAAACEGWGLGLRWWLSDQDGGSVWNPVMDEHHTIWKDASEEAGAVSVISRSPSSLMDAVEIMGRPFDLTGPEDEAENKHDQ